MNEKELKIGSAIDYVSIAEPKFKTNTIGMIFMMPAGKQNNAALSLLQALLTSTSKAYPTIAGMSRKLDSLYGAKLKSSLSKYGDMMQLNLIASVIDNRYAPEKENLLAEITDLLLGCLFAPNAENGAFSETEFRIEQQSLLDAIDAQVNDKRVYATVRATEEAFEGEPFAYPADGTREDAEQLTPASVYEVYKRMLSEAVIRVYHVGPAHEMEIGERLREAFAGIERHPVPLTFRKASPCKEEVKHVTEPMAVNQSKLVAVFKGTAPKKYALNLMSAMFGGTPFSMLFMNVREKLSLCYYCSSSCSTLKQALFVSSGVELSNVERAHTAILEQLDAIRSGAFEDEILENARRSMLEGLHGALDTPYSCISWCHSRFCDEDSYGIPEMMEAYQKLTRQDVIDAANALREDTVYLMQQEVQHE